MVDHGQFERMVPFITVKPQVARRQGRSAATKYEQKFGTEGHPDPDRSADMMEAAHRELPELHAHARETAPGCGDRREGRSGHQPGGAESYREGKTMYWDAAALEGVRQAGQGVKPKNIGRRLAPMNTDKNSLSYPRLSAFIGGSNCNSPVSDKPSQV